MKAVVTGGSSGIGYSIAKYLESQDIDLIIITNDFSLIINKSGNKFILTSLEAN